MQLFVCKHILSRKNRDMKILLLSLLSLISLPAAANLIHLPAKDSVKVFRSSEAYEYNYPVMSGGVLFQEQSDEYYSEGYHASKSIPFSGKRRTIIYDYNSQYSLDFVLERISASLRQQGYFTEYECSGIECGEPDAMQALFDPLMNSYEGRYGYQLFSRNLRNDDVISVYAVLIDSRVRVLIELFGEPVDTRYINLRVNHSEDEYNGLTVYFSPASATLSNVSESLIKDFLDKLASKSTGKLLIKGHSDRTGDAQINKVVSAARAKNVYQLLSNEYTGATCKAQSYGATRPYFYPLSANNKVTDRRVEIVILKQDESC